MRARYAAASALQMGRSTASFKPFRGARISRHPRAFRCPLKGGERQARTRRSGLFQRQVPPATAKGAYQGRSREKPVCLRPVPWPKPPKRSAEFRCGRKKSAPLTIRNQRRRTLPECHPAAPKPCRRFEVTGHEKMVLVYLKFTLPPGAIQIFLTSGDL